MEPTAERLSECSRSYLRRLISTVGRHPLRSTSIDRLLPLNFTNFGWPVLLTLRTFALQLKIIPRLRKPNSAHAIATNHSRFNRS